MTILCLHHIIFHEIKNETVKDRQSKHIQKILGVITVEDDDGFDMKIELPDLSADVCSSNRLLHVILYI